MLTLPRKLLERFTGWAERVRQDVNPRREEEKRKRRERRAIIAYLKEERHVV